jgi:hypothetical protein
MAQENQAQLAVAAARVAVASAHTDRAVKLVALADVEVRAEQVRQQELANMIAMLATPAACPYPRQDVLDRIKELTNLGK